MVFLGLVALLCYIYFALDFKQLQNDVYQTISIAQKKATQIKPPTFEFYTRLPQGQARGERQQAPQPTTISKQKTHRTQKSKELTQALPQTAKEETVAPVSEVQTYSHRKQYIVQVGSFKKFSDADRLRANLILQGYHSRLSRFTNSTTTWYRVEVGPYPNLNQAKSHQNALERLKFSGLIKQIS